MLSKWYDGKTVNILLVLHMSAFMVSAVSNGSESLVAVSAVVRLLTSVSAHVHKKIPFLRKDFAAVIHLTFEEILA